MPNKKTDEDKDDARFWEKMDASDLRRYGTYLKPGADVENAWQAYGKALISSLLGRARFIYRPHDIEIRRDGAAAGAVAPQSDDPTIVIACVSSPISVQRYLENGDEEIIAKSDRIDLKHVAYRDGCQLVQAASEAIPDSWTEERLKELDAALEHDPDIVCFGEYAYPPVWPEKMPGWSINGIREAENRRLRFEAAVVERLKAKKDKPPFVFLGSYHCLMTLYNVGVLYPWGHDTAKKKVMIMREPQSLGQPPRFEPKEFTSPIHYRKRYPARSVGEETRVPAGMDFDSYALPVGRIGVAICSDVVDLNQFLSLARYNLGNPALAIDMLLVPSFNRNPDFVSMCRELSHLSGATVVTVNANSKHSKFPRTNVFCGGFDLDDLEEMSKDPAFKKKNGKIVRKRKPVTVEHTPDRVANIDIITLDRDLMKLFNQQARSKWLKSGAAGNNMPAPVK